MTAMVPALAEIHAAHKARQARMAGVITAPPKPLSFEVAPPAQTIKVPPPVDLSGPIKHQIVVLAATGMESWRIAKRLKITKGAVAGVLYRARAQEHKLLLCDVCLILFELGFDTYEIGGLVDEPERVVYNLIAWGRDRRSAQP